MHHLSQRPAGARAARRADFEHFFSGSAGGRSRV
jgi:hypothetical protein